MSNSRPRFPAPPPPAPPIEEELTISVISIGVLSAVSLVLLIIFLKKMGYCKRLAEYCDCAPDDTIPPPPEFSKKALEEEDDDEEKGLGVAGNAPMKNSGILGSMIEEGDEEEGEDDAKSELSEGSLAAQRVLEASWANPVEHTEEANLEIGVFNTLTQGDLYESSKPPPPPPDDNRRETMDQKLRRLSYEREQAALHLQHAREQRAKFMKRGGRPTASDYAEWNPNSKVRVVDKNSLAAVQAAHDAWVAECEKEDSGHAPEAPSSEEIAKAAALAVRGRRASQGGASRSLWVAPDVLS
jgi:hypothetical protein